MSLRWRIALGFALVALATAAIVALATPPIVGQGFAEVEDGAATPAAGAIVTAHPDEEDEGQEHAAVIDAAFREAQSATIWRLILAAVLAAALASVLGLLAAGRLTAPLGRLEAAAGGLARGNLATRSGLAERSDEFGQLGRTFDSMAGELQRADETRRGFLQDAAHELKTPLAVIDATSSAILDGVYTPERRHIETIRDQSRILARIVDDLRTISLAEGGHLPLDCRPFDLDKAMSSVAAGFEARAAGQGVTLTVDSPAGLAVEADSDRVKQMATGLLDNALRHTPGGGKVGIVVSRVPPARGATRPAVRVSIEDSGSGIPEAALPRIFERFYQADPAHSRASDSSGLGLSIVKALAEAHGGRVGAENMPSSGARLWFELPGQMSGDR
jgi:two-component system, OmpR family, sensor histidine kinase BaeS